MRTRLVCALAAAVLPAGAWAQTVPLTESAMLARLNADSPLVRSARAPVDVARAEILAAGRWPNPRVTFNRESVSGIAEDMLMVTQPLPVTGRRRLTAMAATARAEASAHRAEDQIRRLRADARLAFTDLWAAQEREREMARTHARLTELAGLLAKREAAGDAAGFDRLRAEREAADVEASRSLAASERARAQALLAGFLSPAMPPDTLDAARPAAPDAPLPSVDELVARAASARGTLAALARDEESARFAELAADRLAFPEPEIVGGAKTSNAAGGDTGTIVSVHLTVPLFDRGGPERAEAQARGRQARADADAVRQTIRAQIAAWRAAVVERRAAAARHRAAILQSAGEIERIAQVSYDAGERGILELLDAHRIAANARLRQTELDASVREAEIELEFVSGWELP